MNSDSTQAVQRKNVLLLGGTGSIGGAVAQSLSNRGHRVTCLARSEVAKTQLQRSNYMTLIGDIRNPEQWIEQVDDFDAVIQTAITWSKDMGDVDSNLVSMLMEALSTKDARKTLIYTGGCWIYGETGDQTATESWPHSPIPEFSWGSQTGTQVLTNKAIRGIVIHPAMVYERDGGVLEHMISDAKNLKQIRIIGRPDTSWTMVHRDDLGVLYCLALEKAPAGETYNAGAIDTISVGELAQTLSTRFKLHADPVIISIDQGVRDIGDWASGYAIDQKMSSQKARSTLGWLPVHTEILADIS